MIGYGFGYDPEVPGGFQDADLEMREWEDRANEKRDCHLCDSPTLNQKHRSGNCSVCGRDLGWNH